MVFERYVVDSDNVSSLQIIESVLCDETFQNDEPENSEILSTKYVNQEILASLNQIYQATRESQESEARKSRSNSLQFTSSSSTNPMNPVQSELDLGYYYLKSGDYNSAIRQFKKCKEKTGFNFPGYHSGSLSYSSLMTGVSQMFLSSNRNKVQNHNSFHELDSSLEQINEFLEKYSDDLTNFNNFKILKSKLYLVAGCTSLQEKNSRLTIENLEKAKNCFLQVDHNSILKNNPFDAKNPCILQHLIGPAQLATYTVLTLIATTSRQLLTTIHAKNDHLKTILETNIAMKDILQSFIQAEYKKGLILLDQECKTLRFDEFCGGQIDSVVHEIRKKCILEFSAPFERVGIWYLSEELGMKKHPGWDDSLCRDANDLKELEETRDLKNAKNSKNSQNSQNDQQDRQKNGRNPSFFNQSESEMETIDTETENIDAMFSIDQETENSVSDTECLKSSSIKRSGPNQLTSTSNSAPNISKSRNITKNFTHIDNFYALDYVVDLIACKALPARIDYLSQEVIFERKSEAEQIAKKNLENVAKMARGVKFANQLVVFVSEFEKVGT